MAKQRKSKKQLPIFVGEPKGIVFSEKPKEKLPLSLSVSKIKTFKSCKLKFKFGYILKIKVEGPEREYLILGKFIHGVLEEFHKKQMEGNTDPDHVLMKYCFLHAKNPEREKLTVEQKDVCFKYLGQYLKVIGKEKEDGTFPEILSVEQDFFINLDNKALMVGFIDRVQKDIDGTIHVTDYKTTEKVEYLERDLFQLKVYGYVMCLKDPSIKKIRCSYMLIKHEFRCFVKEFSRDELLLMENELFESIDKINAEELYKPTLSPLCKYCDYLDLCEDGQKYVKEQEERKERFARKPSHGESSW